MIQILPKLFVLSLTLRMVTKVSEYALQESNFLHDFCFSHIKRLNMAFTLTHSAVFSHLSDVFVLHMDQTCLFSLCFKRLFS